MPKSTKKDTVEILNEIRELRGHQLVESKDNRVFYTIAMKLEKGENTKKDIYRIIEEYSVGENQSIIKEFFYEYKDKPELIAKLDPEVADFILVEDDFSVDEARDLLKDINGGRAISEEQAKKQAEKMGIDEVEIEGLSEIDVYKKVDEAIEEKNENSQLNEEKENEPINISEKRAERSGIIGMNSISLDQRVGVHGETLKEELGLDTEEYKDVDSIEIVPAYKLAQIDGGIVFRDVPFIPVGRNSSTGELVVFPKKLCSPYRGENDEVINVDGKDDAVTKQKSNCIFNFGDKDASLVIDQKSPYGIVDASLSYPTRDNDDRLALDLQNRNEDGTHGQDTESLEVINRYQGVYHTKEMAKEAHIHPDKEFGDGKLDDGEVGIKDVDGNPETSTHTHDENQTSDDYIRQLFDEAIDNVSKRGNVSEQEAERLIIQNLNEAKVRPEDIKEKYTYEELKKVVDEAEEESIDDIEEHYRGNDSIG